MKLMRMMNVWAICAMVSATVAIACPDEKVKTAKKDTPCSKSVKTVADKAPCSKSAKTVSDKAPCSKSAKTVSDKAPCSKSAKTVSDKAPCSKSAKTVADKAPCSKSAKKVVTVSNDGRSEASAPCSGSKEKKAKTVSADAKKPCCADKAKKAKTVANKGGCGSGCGAGCPCGKDAELTSAKAGTPCSKSAKASAPCSKSAKAGTPCSKSAKLAADGGCPIEKKINAVLASLPTMKYRVGDKTTPCSKSAAAMAEKSSKSMEYVVGDDATGCKSTATAKLTSMLEEQLSSMQTVQYVVGDHCGLCPMTAKSKAKASGTKMTYRVGGVDFKNKEDAKKVATLVAEAVSAQKMSYKVDGKSYGCSKSADAKCKKTGAKLTYVVGEDETCCEKTAKLMVTEAKIRTAVETAASASMSL